MNKLAAAIAFALIVAISVYVTRAYVKRSQPACAACPPAPTCPPTPTCPSCPECATCPSCPSCPSCPPAPECPTPAPTVSPAIGLALASLQKLHKDVVTSSYTGSNLKAVQNAFAAAISGANAKSTDPTAVVPLLHTLAVAITNETKDFDAHPQKQLYLGDIAATVSSMSNAVTC